MPAPNLIAMLFVDPAFLRRGIGRKLLEAARQHTETMHPAVATIELNSTAYALPFYRALGFVPISRSFEVCGARATRMACWLRADALRAQI